MKIDQIILSLQSIKKENDENISNNNLRINELGKQISKLEKKLNDLKRIENKYDKIGNIRGSMLKTIKVLLIPIEISIIISLLVLIVLLAENFYLCLFFASLCSLFISSIISTYYKEIYPSSEDNTGIIKGYIELFKGLLCRKKHLQERIKEVKETKESLNNNLRDAENERNSLLSSNSIMKEENEYIDGSEVGLNILANKYKMKDVNDDIEIANFVGKRLKRPK